MYFVAKTFCIFTIFLQNYICQHDRIIKGKLPCVAMEETDALKALHYMMYVENYAPLQCK